VTSAQRAQVKKLLTALEAELSDKAPTRIEPSRQDEHEVKVDEDAQPLNEMLQAIASSRNRNQQGVLQKVQKALQKLKEDPKGFGECEECGDDLPWGRLRALPFAEYCVSCQAQKDGPKAGPTRRKITDYT